MDSTTVWIRPLVINVLLRLSLNNDADYLLRNQGMAYTQFSYIVYILFIVNSFSYYLVIFYMLYYACVLCIYESVYTLVLVCV